MVKHAKDYDKFEDIPGDSIRPVNPILSDRIRVGFHRNPTSSLKNRSDPMGLLSDSFQSESDTDFVGIRRNPTKFMSDLVRFLWDSDEFRQNPCRIPTEKNPTTTPSDPTPIIWIRQDPTPHGSPGYDVYILSKDKHFELTFCSQMFLIKISTKLS